MATASNSPSVNSSHTRHSRRELPAGAVQYSSFSVISDRELFMVPDNHEVITPVITPPVTASFLADDAQPEGIEEDGVTKEPVWNKPANGVAPEVGAVMGADSWPALSKSARANSSTDSLKELSHGSLTPSKMSIGSSTSLEDFSNHESPSRQTSMERGGGSLRHSSYITANDSFSQAPTSHSSVVEASLIDQVKSSSYAGVSPRGNTNRDVAQRGGSYSGHEPHQPRGSFRRNNSGPQLQGNGSFNHNHNSKRDKERGKQDWSNNHRSFGRRVNLAPQHAPQLRVASSPFIGGPISNAPIISPPPPPVAVRPYGPPLFYNDMSSFMYYAPGPHPGSLGHMSMVPFAPMFYPIPDPHLHYKIVSQIDYYFSDENLVKDTFLRQKMDVDGWVPINVIANFKKIRELADNVQLILDALRASNVVELQGEKVRRKGNWKKWVMPHILYPTRSSSLSLNNSSLDTLDEKTDTVSSDTIITGWDFEHMNNSVV